MKTIKSILIATVVLGATTFTQAQTVKKAINAENSAITWTGEKVLGSHTGTITFTEGVLEMDGEMLTGGMFTVDMTSINVTDLKVGEGKEKLEGHLKSDDFFGIGTYPTATLAFTKVQKMSDGYEIDASITIKGTTEPISFELATVEDAMTASFKIDRTKHNVRYGSGSFFDSLGDNTISDNFTLDVVLKF
ncbi:MAG: polyisoprenoid-binding protein YceI [Planctomycetota bacterium]|jgi:polyisoprenoid-binding protein YceI|uniref:YceI family protein n=1 Tax=Patiriisocius sp. Uisw_047 TaxID=3230969 RepID=UPI0039ED2DC7